MRIQYPAQESGAIHITRALPHNTTTSLSTELATKPTSTTGLTTKPDDLNETGAGYTVKRKPTDTNTTTNNNNHKHLRCEISPNHSPSTTRIRHSSKHPPS